MRELVVCVTLGLMEPDVTGVPIFKIVLINI